MSYEREMCAHDWQERTNVMRENLAKSDYDPTQEHQSNFFRVCSKCGKIDESPDSNFHSDRKAA